MREKPSGQLGVARTPLDLLAAAASSVAGDVAEDLEYTGIRRQDAIACLDRLVEDLEALLRDSSSGLSTGVMANRFSSPLLDALARAALRLAVSPESAVAAIEILRAVETLKGAPRGGGERIDQGTADDLRSRLNEPDAFELLVEVAHDFRSPLTSILFLAETIRDGHSGPISEHQRSQLGLMYSAAFGLASVASDIMDLARRERDLVDEPEPYPVSEVFTNVERLVRPIVEEKGLVLRVVVPERARAVGHPHALSRVMLNLTTNALKFTDHGSVEIGVRARPRERLDYYVRDTGRGIPVARQAELYQPFKRRRGASCDGHFFSGSGVGLSIARRLVEGMGSELHFETSDETGTHFWFQVPTAPGRSPL